MTVQWNSSGKIKVPPIKILVVFLLSPYLTNWCWWVLKTWSFSSHLLAANPPHHSIQYSAQLCLSFVHLQICLVERLTSKKLCSSPSFPPKTSKDEIAKSSRNSHWATISLLLWICPTADHIWDLRDTEEGRWWCRQGMSVAQIAQFSGGRGRERGMRGSWRDWGRGNTFRRGASST